MSKTERTDDDAEDEMAAFPCREDRFFEFFDDEPSIKSQFFRNQDWYFFLNGYKNAADFLVTHAIEEGAGDPRKLLYPIMFLYRHYLELALKSLIREHKTFPPIHELDKLWGICLSLLGEISPGASDNDEIQHTTRLIEEFCKVDPKSALAFRYPDDGIQPEGVVETDLSKVKEVVGKISLLLDCIGEVIRVREYDAF
ncbi:MAG: hypothetical protein ACLQJ7_06580 [Syntrophobacteraceae bacterium]